ncbi:MAG: DUF4857 domain-containing protein [Ignavibacteriaceae bacterium]|nr:DUF4857 domain-containing protein [Ignavibacteriaceae bacterium]
MNIKSVKILLAAAIIFISSIYLPDIFWSTFKYKSDRPSVSFSPIVNDFLFTYPGKDNSSIRDRKGKTYTRDEYEAAMPQLNFAQLMFSGKMPDSVNGVKVDVPMMRKNLFQSRFEPSTIDGLNYMLNPLIESSSGRVNLEYPNEFFIIKNRMEIIDARTNSVNEEMTKLFTDALSKSGFVFPAKEAFGNPTTRKPYDEGYFVVDAKDQFFHIKRIKDKPFCKKIYLPKGIKVVHMNVHEIALKEFYGIFVTEDNGLYFLSYGDYKTIKLAIEDYNYKTSSIRILGDLFHRTISVNNEDSYSVFVFDRNYNLKDKYTGQLTGKYESAQGKISAYVFPFSLSILSNKTMFVNFFLKFIDFRFFAGNIILLLGLIGFFLLKKIPVNKNLFSIILVAIAGIYGLIAVLVIRDFFTSNNKKLEK